MGLGAKRVMKRTGAGPFPDYLPCSTLRPSSFSAAPGACIEPDNFSAKAEKVIGCAGWNVMLSLPPCMMKFAIGVMKPDGSGERILTEGFHNEGPTWAPNSRVLMFFRDSPGENGGPQLYSVDITGYNEQQVPTPGFSSDPAWSPKLN